MRLLKFTSLPALFLLTVGTLTASAQGTVTFQNSVAFQTPDPTGGNRLVYDCGIFLLLRRLGVRRSIDLRRGFCQLRLNVIRRFRHRLGRW